MAAPAARVRQRSQDIEESYYLLLELCCCEPTLQQAFAIIENICLAHGVTATEAGRALSPEFQSHIDQYWVPFLGAAIRAAHIYGFVPWRLRRLTPSDARVPEVLPPGTFRWAIEVPPDEENQQANHNRTKGDGRPGGADENRPPKTDAMLRYTVKLNPGQREEKRIHITDWSPPRYMVNESSIMYATVPSPLSYVIESFKHLQAAIKRQAHADAWNCTARLTVSHEPKEFLHEQHRADVQNAFGDFVPERGIFSRMQYAPPENPREQVLDTFLENSMNHRPAVYPLPSWRHLESAPVLQPVMDIPYMQAKYRHDVSALLGIPMEMLGSGEALGSSKSGGGSVSSAQRVRGSHSNSRIFQAKMQRMCTFLRGLCQEVYRVIYDRDAVFDILPMPRLEVRDIDDLKNLYEIGVIQPQHTLDLATILLGNLKRARKQQLTPGMPTGNGGSEDPFEPSDNRKRPKQQQDAAAKNGGGEQPPKKAAAEPKKK